MRHAFRILDVIKEISASYFEAGDALARLERRDECNCIVYERRTECGVESSVKAMHGSPDKSLCETENQNREMKLGVP